MVDRLLASPRYGETWGRHWLDVARYADSTGADEDYRYPHAWRYRDYVIDAFNATCRSTGSSANRSPATCCRHRQARDVNTEGIIATGFLALGPKLVAEQDKVKMFYDIVDEQIDVTGKAFLGLTIACARCHDHKFDPISTKDYYSLGFDFRQHETAFEDRRHRIASSTTRRSRQRISRNDTKLTRRRSKTSRRRSTPSQPRKDDAVAMSSRRESRTT